MATFLLLCLSHGLDAFAAESNQVAAPVATFSQFYALSPEQASKGLPIHIEGVVLCYDLGWNQLYVHDGVGTAWLDPQQFHTNLYAGQKVEITGATSVSGSARTYANLQLRPIGKAPLPSPKKLRIEEMASDFGEWIQTYGRVRVAEESSGRIALLLQDERRTCLVYVMGPIEGTGYKSLLGCQIQINGINGSKVSGGVLESAALTAPGMEAITILRKPEIKWSEIPATSVDALLSRKLGAWTNEPVRLSGSVLSYKPGSQLVFKDATGVIPVRVIQTTAAHDGERVEVWGYLSDAGGEAILNDGYFEVRHSEPAFNGRPQLPKVDPASPNDQPEITEIAAISTMSRAAAAEGRRVRLHAVVTFADPDWRNSFVLDAGGAIYVELRQKDIAAGQIVEITGRTSPGGFAPEVVEADFRVLGTTNLPPPVKADLQDLANGHLDANWVQMQGVVRRVSEEEGRVTLSIMTPKGRFKALVLKQADEPAPNLEGALIEVEGACTSEMNARGQLTGVLLHAPGFEQIRVLEPVPSNRFSIPIEKISSVATFEPDRLAGRQVRVSGVVTMVLPGEGFYLQDESGGIRVNAMPGVTVRLGDSVDVLGFPSVGQFSPCLEEAAVRNREPVSSPKPSLTTPEEILTCGTNDAMLVQVEGRLVRNVEGASRPKLLLQSGSVIFPATLMSQPDAKTLSKLRIGSLLQLTGVCVVQGGESREPESFSLLVPASDQIEVLQTAPWWTRQNSMILLGTVALCATLVWLWSASLRRQVQAQTELIRRNEQELIRVSRQAGMAEVASSVLHNVGNVLNSVNVSVQVASTSLKNLRISGLPRLAGLLNEHADDLGKFVTEDARGRAIPNYIAQLADQLAKEQGAIMKEMQSLSANIQHISEIIVAQQNFARVSGVTEKLRFAEIIEDAVRINLSSFERHAVRILLDYDPQRSPEVIMDRHKVIQILVNLLNNAEHACAESERPDKQVTIRLREQGDAIHVACEDNGVGIPEENLSQIFIHGFTTRKDGHGFGLHTSALAAREMGGRLKVESKGRGHGATFTLELPKFPMK